MRIVRHGGWSWGPHRRALLEQATAALPRLIAERLAELMSDADGEIVQPIRLRFALRAGQLANGEGLARVVASGLRPEMLPLPKRNAKQASRNSRTAIEADIASQRSPPVASRVSATVEARLPGPAQVLLDLQKHGLLANIPAAVIRRAPHRIRGSMTRWA